MFNHVPTNHASRRCAQRGISELAIQSILAIGIEVEGGYLVTQQAAREKAASLRREADIVERIAGRRVVIDGDRLVTAYMTTKSKRRHLIMRAEQRNLEL